MGGGGVRASAARNRPPSRAEQRAKAREPLRIGTRGSALALAQSGLVRDAIAARCGLAAQLVPIRTSGDRIRDRPLADVGGKGLFVKEIEEALLAARIDCAVHSMKDMPASLPPGLEIGVIPPREDPRDVSVTRDGRALEDLPTGARVGTSSLRRAALVRALRPDLEVVPLRGNVDTRLRRLEEGLVDCVLLAAAGLNRLGLAPSGLRFCDPEVMVPAVGQGALAVETRASDTLTSKLKVLDHAETRAAVTAERAFLQRVGGSCFTPLGAHATVCGDSLRLLAFIASPDGERMVRGEESGTTGEAAAIGARLADRLLKSGGSEILEPEAESP